MSGPKTTRYTLTPEQRRILEEQRKLEQRRAAAKQSLKASKKRILQIKSVLSAGTPIADELKRIIGTDGGFAEKAKNIEALTESANKLTETNTDDVEALERASAEASKQIKKAETLSKELEAITAENEKRLQSHINESIDKGFSSSFDDIKDINADLANAELEEAKEKIRKRLFSMRDNPLLPAEMKLEIEQALASINDINDEVYFKNHTSITVTPLLKRCNEYLEEHERCYEEYDFLHTEYISLCDMYGYVAQDFPCCEASVKKLKDEITRIKAEAAEDDEQAYISECLDEVMTEMGYTVIGSREVTKKNGKRFRNELYTYGDGTAVNVTYSPDGRIAMEIGGIDTVDRIPNAQETAVLCESMEDFCGNFKEIEKRLLAKGVVLAERIALLPPNAEHAQIINTSDYQMVEKADRLQAKKRKRSISKRKALSED